MPRLTLLLEALSLVVAAPAHAQHPDSPRIARAKEDSIRAVVGGWYDDMLGAAGLLPLDRTPLPDGVREVRIWSSVALGVPQALYRFVERDRKVAGELIFYWDAPPPDTAADERPGETIDDLLRYSLPGRCDHFRKRDNVSACRARFNSAPPWKTVLDTMEADGLWTLPDPSTLPKDNVIVVDGWSIAAEVRDGTRYHRWGYDNPDANKSWASATEAIAISRALVAINSLVAPANVQRHYRGVTTGHYGSVFHDCAGGDWQFREDIRGMRRRGQARDSVALGDTTAAADTTQLYYVEVIGELTPEWLARRWRVAEKRVLQPSRLLIARPWPGRGCPAK